MRASFLLPWFTHNRDKKLRAGARTLRRAPFCFAQIFYNYNTEWGQHLLSFFLLATSLLSESMVSFDRVCSVEALARWLASRKAKAEARQVSRQEAQCFSTWRFKGRAARRAQSPNALRHEKVWIPSKWWNASASVFLCVKNLLILWYDLQPRNISI